MSMSDVSAQVDQLLGRPARPGYGPGAVDLVAGRRILVTGAGGSIGSELVRQVVTLDPAQVFLLDHDESHLHAVQLEVFGNGQLDDERTVLADIRDGARLTRLFEELRPDVVFHAAALKHLTILERYPSEAVRTNTMATQNVIDACVAAGVERLIFVSTDKAADPTSVLGASKHLAEVLVRQAAAPTLRTSSVRFGNVLGSRGSFLHTLRHQMSRALPVTVTHPDVERFFMSIPEAASLVVEASVMAEAGEVYVLDMGEPVRILDLVDRFARLQGMATPQIRVTGLVGGEKLSEELKSTSERWDPTSTAKVWRVADEVAAEDPRCCPDEAVVAELYRAALRGDDAAVRDGLLRCGYGLTAGSQVRAVETHVPAQRGTRETVA